ncbi:MAG: DUF1800 domain-containing protein [Gemmatimonadetes bacterium]|nr:DUF1800 domain-containing protein [Gemmatimonadota bacterium]
MRYQPNVTPTSRSLAGALLLMGLAGLAVPPAGIWRAPSGTPPDSAARARALHALNRLTYGPRPGDVDRVVAIGIDRFIDEQLSPEKISDQALEQRLATYEVLKTSPEQMARVFAQAQRQQLQQRRERGDSMRPQPPEPGMMPDSAQRARLRQDAMDNPLRRLLGQYQQATMARAVMSERQLYEVMVDFWTNHFNVFIGKGADRFLLPGYIEETIRPRALGTFDDLLIAVAKSPAMLFYLDNAQSVAPGSEPPQLARLRQARGRPGRMGFGMNPERAESLMARAEERRPKGINENYARELMELHTLGVDGGYTQQDVQNVARILTGWSINQPRQRPEFVFNEWAHDHGVKTVLGQRFPAGRGMDEGVELLHALAKHPATMRHVSEKLCARLVRDDPPDGCVDAAVHAWERTGGDIRAVVRAIVTSPDFWAPENRAAKVKTPLEFLVSAVRAVGASPDTTPALAMLVARLGQPLFGQQPPTGYPETRESLVNSGALLQRMNIALGIAAGRAPGVRVDLDRLALPTADIETLVSAVNKTVLNGTASANTLKTMRDQTRDLSGETARTMVVGMALGSPEFQRQ